MRKACFAVVAVLVLLPAASASAQERHSCGNYGYTEGSTSGKPVFTDEPIVGAGVEGIRTRVIGCPKGRRMVKAFWNDRFDCNQSGLRCTYGSFRCRNRRLGDEYWLMRCFASGDRMLKFRFGA
jgi:hypothetical protein